MKVHLLSSATDLCLLADLWVIWQLSRTNDPLEKIVKELNIAFELEKFFSSMLEENVPLLEMFDFIFVLEDIPISLREQLVRHRIGVKIDERVGIDIVPDLPDSTFWSQSMRVLDMSEFDFFIPETIQAASDDNVASIYGRAMWFAKSAYAALIKAGVPREDARNVIPLGATHRIVWKLNLAAIKHILSKRSCWILQLGLWKPIILGMIEELSKINKNFKKLVTPPCMKGDAFKGCQFCESNKNRILGEDLNPACSLYMCQQQNDKASIMLHPKSMYFLDEKAHPHCSDEKMNQRGKKMVDAYREFWNRDPFTGQWLG